MEASTTKAELIAKIDELNYDKRIHGILVQLPLPEALHREEQEILRITNPEVFWSTSKYLVVQVK